MVLHYVIGGVVAGHVSEHILLAQNLDKDSCLYQMAPSKISLLCLFKYGAPENSAGLQLESESRNNYHQNSLTLMFHNLLQGFP
jgi:hypothetical protein